MQQLTKRTFTPTAAQKRRAKRRSNLQTDDFGTVCSIGLLIGAVLLLVGIGLVVIAANIMSGTAVHPAAATPSPAGGIIDAARSWFEKMLGH